MLIKYTFIVDVARTRSGQRWGRGKLKNCRRRWTSSRWRPSFVHNIMLSNTADIFHQAQVLSEKTKLKQMDDDMEGILSSINSI